MIENILHLIFKIMMFIFYNGKIEKRLNNILIEKVEVGKNIRMLKIFIPIMKRWNFIRNTNILCSFAVISILKNARFRLFLFYLYINYNDIAANFTSFKQ